MKSLDQSHRDEIFIEQRALQKAPEAPLLAALPPDVRKVYNLPVGSIVLGLCPDFDFAFCFRLKHEGAQPRKIRRFRKVGDLPHIGRHSRKQLSSGNLLESPLSINIRCLLDWCLCRETLPKKETAGSFYRERFFDKCLGLIPDTGPQLGTSPRPFSAPASVSRTFC